MRKLTQNKAELEERPDISRKEALKKIGNYGKYTALTAIGTYLMLHPKRSQASSPSAPGTGGDF